MSTLPRHPIGQTAAGHQVPVVPAIAYESLVDEAVSEFESGAEWLGVPRPSTAELHELCRKVAALTSELFPAGMKIRVRNDPEIASDVYFVFDVVTSGNVDDIVTRDNEWHRRLRQDVGNRAELFCLTF
jgi:hypothetical protein